VDLGNPIPPESRPRKKTFFDIETFKHRCCIYYDQKANGNPHYVDPFDAHYSMEPYPEIPVPQDWTDPPTNAPIAPTNAPTTLPPTNPPKPCSYC